MGIMIMGLNLLIRSRWIYVAQGILRVGVILEKQIMAISIIGDNKLMIIRGDLIAIILQGPTAIIS